MNFVTLVEGGKPRFRVLPHPTQDQESFRGPLIELVSYLEAAVGERVTVEEPRPVEIVLHFAPDAKLGKERFVIDADESAIRLVGSTVQALYHAVYTFLEGAFGVRWLWPGPSGEVVPRAGDVKWPVGRTASEPHFKWRRLATGGAVWQRFDLDFAARAFCGVPSSSQEAFNDWARRMRAGGLEVADGHRFGQLCSAEEYGESHPEYFALVDGKRDAQPHDGKHGNHLCTSNDEVVQLVARKICAYFDARPTVDVFSIAMNDGHGFCECEACRAIDEWAGSGTHTLDEVDRATYEGPGVGKGGRAITDRVFLFSNRVAEEVAKHHPDKLLLIIVYSLFRTPPKKVRLHPNIIAQFCTPTPEYVVEAFRAQELATLARLGQSADHVGIYDYYEYGKRGGVPFVFTRTASQAVKDIAERGVRYYATQTGYGFAIGGLNYYLLARLLWNPELDPDEIVDDYCRAGFGKAAAQVRRFFEAFEERWNHAMSRAGSQRFGTEALVRHMYSPEFIEARRSDLAHARSVAGDDAVIRRLDFLEQGLDFVSLLVEAVLKTEELERLGVRLGNNKTEARESCRTVDAALLAKAVTAAMEARSRLFEFVREHAGRFVCSETWFHYWYFSRVSKLKQLDHLSDLAFI